MSSGALRHEVAVDAQGILRLLQWVEYRPGEDRAHRVRPELEGRHDAEVAAAAAQCPEQVRVLLGAGGEEATVGGHDVGRDQVVAGRDRICERGSRCRRRA